MTDFDHIRPYHDEEVPAVVSRLVSDPEFVDSIAQFSFPRLNQWFPWLIQPLVKTALARKASQINSVDSLQLEAKKYLSQTIESTTTKLTTSGLDNLRANEPHLFISNHRDIAMDPAFVNYALFTHGRDTLRIAIGDNLLQKPFASDLMRLNKSFIVQRSAKGVREKMAAYLGLSSYIDHSISEGCSIWIAQQEGRAKDGIDQTDPAIIKMLYMCQKKGNVSFSDHMNKLNIVPVAISYEYNPCDETRKSPAKTSRVLSPVSLGRRVMYTLPSAPRSVVSWKVLNCWRKPLINRCRRFITCTPVTISQPLFAITTPATLSHSSVEKYKNLQNA